MNGADRCFVRVAQVGRWVDRTHRPSYTLLRTAVRGASCRYALSRTSHAPLAFSHSSLPFPLCKENRAMSAKFESSDLSLSPRRDDDDLDAERLEHDLYAADPDDDDVDFDDEDSDDDDFDDDEDLDEDDDEDDE